MTITKLMAILTASVLITCGGGGEEKPQPAAQVQAKPTGLTQDQIEHGIGPIAKMVLPTLDPALVETGRTVFDLKCVACHKPNERLVGPPLAGVTDRRSPAFIMNMILNPDEMVKKHPEIKALLAQYYVPMTFQNVSQDDARAILEYLRTLKQEQG